MSKTLDRTDLLLPITFVEEEARFLGGLVHAAVLSPRVEFSEDQHAAASRIASKFMLAGEALKAELIEEHGIEAVLALAERVIAEHPTIEEVAL